MMKIVNKPWGYEKWVEGEGCVLKEIFMKAGTRSSLQYHKEKDEVMLIKRGQGIMTVNDDKLPFKPDSSFHIGKGTIHRVEAITDLVLYEASTPQLDDVVRLNDDWNRPDGRIESEHK